SGGALPVADGVVISLARLDRVLGVDLDRGRVVVEPGVTNLDITRAVAPEGFYYAPDPSSQQVCTIGGNVAENSGGAHCLKHGFTVNHVLAVTAVLPTGEVVELHADDPGPGLLGAFVGSEGTLGIATEITLRLLRRPAPGGGCAGRAARLRSPRWAASRAATTSRTASSRGRSSLRCCAGSPSSSASTASGSATSSTPATETSTRSSSTTRRSRASRS